MGLTMCCEKCWADAYIRSMSSGQSQADEYTKLLKERANHPCTLRQQAGQFWDAIAHCDSRVKDEV